MIKDEIIKDKDKKITAATRLFTLICLILIMIRMTRIMRIIRMNIRIKDKDDKGRG